LGATFDFINNRTFKRFAKRDLEQDAGGQNNVGDQGDIDSVIRIAG
jgi:hypothetical protein